MSELLLGTAQFGESYGATNSIGRIDDAGMKAILTVAHEAKIDCFDTAQDYGDSQRRLGALNPHSSSYVSKFSFGTSAVQPDAQQLFEGSMDLLAVQSLRGLLFHRMADLADPRRDETWAIMRDAQEKGRIRRIGVSVYDEDDLQFAVSVLPGLDLVQIPGNLLDRRLLDSPLVASLAAAGVEIHVRSAYLQGLLLAPLEAIPTSLAGLLGPLRGLRNHAAEHGVSMESVALGFLRDHPVVDGVVVGATTADELSATVAAWNAPGIPEAGVEPVTDETLLDPRRWAIAQ